MKIKHLFCVPLVLMGIPALITSVGAASPAVTTEKPIRVVLVRRPGNGAYEKSAYSFRYASQEARVHRNQVDLVFNACGLIHINPVGKLTSNEVILAPLKRLNDVKEVPEGDWLVSCFAPTKGTVYLMRVDDGTTKFMVKFRIVDSKPDKVTLEWMPHRGVAAQAGTMGNCGGAHSSS
jgi:hypothetical protein